MKRLGFALWLILMLAVFRAQGAPARVQAPVPIVAAGSSTTISQAFSGPVALDHTITVGAACGLNGTAVAADDLGNVYTLQGTKQHTTDVFTSWVFTAPVTVVGTPTVTVTFGAPTACTFRNLTIAEYAGTPVPVVLDGTIAQGSGTGATFTTGNFTTSVAADIFVCIAASGSSTGVFSSVTGWTEWVHQVGADAIYLFDQFPSAAGTYACAGNLASTSNLEWIVQAIALKGVVPGVRHRVITD